VEIALKGQKKIENKDSKKKVFTKEHSVNMLFEIRLSPLQG